MHRYFYILVILILLFSVTVLAGDGNGGYAGAFLQIPIGARPSGMGGAYIAIANDGTGIYFNPAGIVDLKNTLFSSSYRTMGLDRTLGNSSLIFPTQKNSAIGVTWLYAGSGSVEARNTDGDKLGYEFSQHNHAFSVVFAKRFENYVAAGFKATYLHTSFAEMTAFTVSFDIGLMFYINNFFDRETRALMPVQDIQVGLVVRNLAANYRWNSEKYLLAFSSDVTSSTQEDNVPFEFGLGSSARFLERKLLVAVDLVKNQKLDIAFHSGAEYFVSPEFALRSGYTGGRFTAGSGYIFKLNKIVLAIDYAFSTDKVDEGSEHIFSFDLLF